MHFETTSEVLPNSSPTSDSPHIENGKFSGETWFDPDLGMVVESVEHQSREISNRGPTQKIEQTVRVTLVDVTDAEK